MTEQELREKFEKIKNDNGCIGLLNNEFKWFQKGYSLAQETIEKQKKEIETLDDIIKYQLNQIKANDEEIKSLKRAYSLIANANTEKLFELENKDKAIAEARELIITLLRWDTEKEDEKKAKAWLGSNK